MEEKDFKEQSTAPDTEASEVDAASEAADAGSETAEAPPPKEGLNVFAEIRYWVGVAIFAVVVSQFLTRCVIINAIVPSGSMEDTIQIGDRLMGLRFSYWFSDPQRGDVVIFKFPVDESRDYIKRVIGLPGEHVDITDGKVYIDGSAEPLEEDYLKEEWFVENDGLSYDVPEGCFFVMGDNRNDSADSRYWIYEAMAAGLANSREEAEPYSYVKKSQILGKAYFVYYDHFQIIR